MRRREGLKRRGVSREPLRRYLIVCEGVVTEKQYFNDVRTHQKIPIDVEIIAGGVPRTLVEWAIERRAEAARQADRAHDSTLIFDEVWVVCDVDTHPCLNGATQQARQHGISIAISNPSFELWALLHFQDQTRHIERDKLRRLCQKHISGYDKRLPYPTLVERYDDALARALKLQKWHEGRDTVGANPSTGVHILVESIRSQRRDWRR